MAHNQEVSEPSPQVNAGVGLSSPCGQGGANDTQIIQNDRSISTPHGDKRPKIPDRRLDAGSDVDINGIIGLHLQTGKRSGLQGRQENGAASSNLAAAAHKREEGYLTTRRG